MTISDEKLHLHAWGISAALHGIMIGLALYFAAQIQPLQSKEPFHWEVSLVQAVAEASPVAPTEPVPSPQPPTSFQKATPPVEPVPQIVTRQVHTTETSKVVERERPQIVEQAKPIVQPQEVEQRQEVNRESLQPQQVQVAERPVERRAEEIVRSEPTQEISKSEAVESAAQPVNAQAPVTVDHQASAATVIQEEVHHIEPIAPSLPSVQTVAPARDTAEKSKTPAAQAVPQVSEVSTAPVVTAQASPIVAEAPVQVAKAAPSGPDVKADHRWLAESLWRRVAELKRYPAAARMNGLEGRVILRAVIRSDGHLAEVSVQKSSGHSVLDTAAMDAVRLACPLRMKHELGTPQIIVSLPIVYSLVK